MWRRESTETSSERASYTGKVNWRTHLEWLLVYVVIHAVRRRADASSRHRSRQKDGVAVVVGNFIVRRRIGRQRSSSRQVGNTTQRRRSTWQRAGGGREAGTTESLPPPHSPSLTRSVAAAGRRIGRRRRQSVCCSRRFAATSRTSCSQITCNLFFSSFFCHRISANYIPKQVEKLVSIKWIK